MAEVAAAPVAPTAPGAAELFELITRVVFQSGLSAAVVAAKWDGFREAFAGFDPGRVARFTPEDVDRLSRDAGIIRNRRKIEATIENADRLVELEAAGGVGPWLAGHDGRDALVHSLRGTFSYLGPAGINYVLHVIDQAPDGEVVC